MSQQSDDPAEPWESVPPVLPIDPDVEDSGPPRPLHLQFSSLVLVFLGGTCGTAAREAVSLSLGSWSGVPLGILTVNLLGAFLLGVLLEQLAMRGPDEGVRRRIRLLLGTGFMGGFTTYSTLAVGTATLARDGSAGTAIAYGLGTVIIGALATWLGMHIGRRAPVKAST